MHHRRSWSQATMRFLASWEACSWYMEGPFNEQKSWFPILGWLSEFHFKDDKSLLKGQGKNELVELFFCLKAVSPHS